MTKRIILAGVLGGIAMFVWSSVAHIVLPLGEIGIKEIPHETVVLDTLKTALGDAHGLYLYPGMGVGPNASREQKHAAMDQYGQKLAANPSGILIYHPPGAQALTPRQLGTEFITEFLEAVLAAFLLSRTRLAGYGSRVAFITVVGIVAAITTNIPYWNWYGFPRSYTAAYMAIEIVDFLVAGLVIAAFIKGTASTA